MLSFVVPAYNSARTIENCLRSILDQRLDGIETEIIVVDNGSKDATGDLVARMPAVQLVHESVPGAAAARNRGIAEARGDLIALVDSDCEIPSGWSRRALDLLKSHPEVCGVGGPGRMPPDSILARCMNGLHYGLNSNTSRCYVRSLATMDALYVGSVLRDYPFDPNCYWGEDADMNLRLIAAGYKLLFDPSLAVTHHHPISLGGILHKWYEYGIQYPVPYLKKKRFLFDPGFLPRVAYLPLLLLLLVASLFNPIARYLALAVLISLPAVYSFLGLKAVRGLDRLAFPLIHSLKQWAHMIGMLVGLLLPSQRVRRVSD